MDEVQVWEGDRLVESSATGWWGERNVAGHGLIAFVGGGERLPPAGGPVVLDPTTGDLVAYAPIRDPNAV